MQPFNLLKDFLRENENMKCDKCNKEFKGVANQSICSECLKKGKNKSKKLKTPNTIRTNLFTNPSNNIY